MEQRTDAEDLIKGIDNATAYTKGLVAMVGAAELATAAPMVAGRLTAIRDGTQRMAPCVQAPARGFMVKVDEAAVNKAVKERVVVAKGTRHGSATSWVEQRTKRLLFHPIDRASCTPLVGVVVMARR